MLSSNVIVAAFSSWHDGCPKQIEQIIFHTGHLTIFPMKICNKKNYFLSRSQYLSLSIFELKKIINNKHHLLNSPVKQHSKLGSLSLITIQAINKAFFTNNCCKHYNHTYKDLIPGICIPQHHTKDSIFRAWQVLEAGIHFHFIHDGQAISVAAFTHHILYQCISGHILFFNNILINTSYQGQ